MGEHGAENKNEVVIEYCPVYGDLYLLMEETSGPLISHHTYLYDRSL